MAARECYVAIMEMDDHIQAMSIEEHQTTTEPVETLEKVFLNDSNQERTTKIGTLVSPTVRQELTAFLRSNRDVFAWTHEDMPGIDPSVIVHRPVEEASVHLGTRPSHSGGGPQTSGSKLHKGGILP